MKPSLSVKLPNSVENSKQIRNMELKINIVEASSRLLDDGGARTSSGMEAVHHADARPWIGPEIELSKHFQQLSALALETRAYQKAKKIDSKTGTDRRIRQLLEDSGQLLLTDSLFREISNNCNPDNFSLKKEVDAQQQFTEIQGKYPKYVPCSIPPSGVKTLKTLELQQMFLAKTTEKERFKRMRSLRMPNNAHFEAGPAMPTRINPDLAYNEVLVAIRVYRPIKASTRNIASAMTTSNRCVQEIYALGTNKLSQLRDLIKCPGDYMIPGDLSRDSSKLQSALEKAPRNAYKSAFFFIGDIFYNDMRFPGCHDLSEGIREWASETKRKLDHFETKNMEDTSINELRLRLGYPYVYVHQGDHEHLISFVDARLVSADDVQKPTSYPYERSVGMVHSKMCMACNTFIAKWITTQNERVPEEPFFFCEECFRQFNYGPKNEKLGGFKAFSYIDVNAL